MKQRKFSPVVKVVLFQLIYVVLHFLYDWAPNGLTTIVSGINESVYQHLKVSFFSYIPVILIEYLWLRQSLPSLKRFLTARLFTLVFMPWVMMTFFLFSPLVFGKIESIPGEILFANAALLCTFVCSLVAEHHVEKTEPGRGLIAVLSILGLLILVQFVVFTNRLPWFDIFATPPGW